MAIKSISIVQVEKTILERSKAIVRANLKQQLKDNKSLSAQDRADIESKIQALV